MMNGLIALLGSGEYLPVMDEIDRRLLASVSDRGRAPRVVCLPTAAGQEGEETVNRWSRMGEEHFQGLGAQVQALPIIDRTSADDPEFEKAMESADLIYFSGGSPLYLFETMKDSLSWAAAQSAWDRGAVYAGCSAGAMILAKRLPNFRRAGVGTVPGFGLLEAEFVMPHFDHAGPWKFMMDLVRRQLKDGQYMLGIDEDTALVGRIGGEWKAFGKSRVHVLTRKASTIYADGETVHLS